MNIVVTGLKEMKEEQRKTEKILRKGETQKATKEKYTK
jgi:hypothetical protein